MTIISKYLLDDHDRIKRLFTAFNQSPSTYSAMNVIEELKTHSTIEEELVYPVVREQNAALADDAEADHAEVADLISEIESRDPNDPTTMKLMSQLERDMMRHLAEEERAIFPLLKQRPGFDPLLLGSEAFGLRQELIAEREPMRRPSNVGWGGNAGW